MKPLITFFLIAISFCYTTTAQPTITFYPSDGTTLTRQDVDNTLAAHGLTRDSEFHAVIEEATEIGSFAFISIKNLISAKSSSVIIIRVNAFMNCNNLVTVNFPVAEILEPNSFKSSGLVTADFPSVDIIYSPFESCYNLTTINFPVATIVFEASFVNCLSLTAASFGTGFNTETQTYFGTDVFGPSE